MQHDRIHRVVYVETSLSGSEVRATFSQYGRIRDIYPCKNGPHRDFARYFVEFEHENSAKGARNLESPRYSVHIPAHSPRLASCFWDIVSPERTSPVSKRDVFYQASGSVDRSNCRRATHIPRLLSPGNKGVQRTYMRPSGSRLESATESPKRPVWTSAVRYRPNDHEKENRAITPPSRQHVSPRHGISTPSTHNTNISSRQPVPGVSTPRYRNPDMSAMASQKAIKAEPDVDASPTSQEDTRGVSKPVLSEPQPVAPSTSPLITLSHDGSRYSCPLDEFTEDPANAITVLTQTAAGSSERDKWMIVAAHCRRKQKVRAAISILMAMVDVMTSPGVGLTQDDMKPVYLMLGSCYTDLSRQVRGLDGEGVELAKENMVKASEYFRMVYGEYVPDSLISHSPASLPSRIQGPTDKYAPIHSPVAPSRGTSAAGRKRKDPPLPNDEVGLRREIQSLRDRQKHHLSTLDDLRDTKRRLEAELETARADLRDAKRGLEEELESTRADLRDAKLSLVEELQSAHALHQKAEETLVETTEELQGARRSAQYALEQCKREVENRRRVEERARDEVAAAKIEAEAVARSAHDKERRARDCFARLGSLFITAAHGELEDAIAPMLSGPSGSRRSVEVMSPSQPGRPWKRARTESA